MPDEKSIERTWVLSLRRMSQTGSFYYVVLGRASAEDDPRVEVMPVEDHVAALGEATSTLSTELASVRKHRDELKEALGRAPYPSDVEAAEAGREEETERADTAEEKLQTLRADIATVRGHLEGYADGHELITDWDHRIPPEWLAKALREDAAKLKLSAGEGDRS